MVMLTLLIGAMQAAILHQFYHLRCHVRCIMATLAEVNATLDAVAAGVDELEAAIADLKDQVAHGSPVSQADLDALGVKVSAISADIEDKSDQG